MSILIKGMNIPKSCAECNLKSYGLEGLKCCATKSMFYRGRHICEVVDECREFRHPCCPIVTTRSRLIEENDVFSIIDRFAGYLDEDMIFRIKFAIKNHTKTIVDTEEMTYDKL